MPEQVPFIGRERIVEQIFTLIDEWQTNHTVCIEAPGGIGKTRLAEEIYQQCVKKSEKKFLIVLKIFDFDDQSLISIRSLQYILAQLLNEEIFEPYFKALETYQNMRIGGVPPETLNQEMENINTVFIECFNRISEQSRIVVFYDTTDRLQEEQDFCDKFVSLIAQLHNVFHLLTGRNAESLGKCLQDKIAHIHLIQLEPLNEEESKCYLAYKRDVQYLTIPSDIAQRLIFLAEGKPILLDLAIEWLSRNVPLDWLREEDFSEIQEERRREFERLLVQPIAQVRTPMQMLTLIMSHVYPLNVKMIGEFIKGDDPQQLFEEAKTYVFVKLLPNGYITLHDEMRRMINEYVLPKTDSEIVRRLKNYSKLATTYFKRKKEELEQAITQLKDSIDDPIKLAQQREEKTQQHNSLLLQYIKHAIFSDPEQGVEAYCETIRQLRSEFKIPFALRLQKSIKEYVPDLSTQQRVRYDIQEARLFHDTGNSQEAVQLLERVLVELRPNQVSMTADTYNALAVSELALGKLNRALQSQRACLTLLEKNKQRKYIPNVANNVGYIYEQRGELSQAINYYKKALHTALDLGHSDLDMIASILANLSYAYCQIGFYFEAQNYIDHAMTIWKQLGQESQIARGEITQSIIYQDQAIMSHDQKIFDAAMNHLYRAIARLREPEHHQQLMKAYMHKGLTEWLWGESIAENPVLNAAKKSLNQSYGLAEKYRRKGDMPEILCHISQVYWHLDDKETAYLINQKAYDLSREVHAVRSEVSSLLNKAEFDYAEGKYDTLAHYANILRTEYKEKGYDFPSYYGQMDILQANVAFKREEYEEALGHYTRGLIQIRRYRRYGQHMIKQELNALHQRLDMLPSEIALQWIDYMQKEWSKQEPDIMYYLMVCWCESQVVDIKLRAIG